MTGFQIQVRARMSEEFPELVELTMNQHGVLSMVLAMSREHYASSCVILGTLAGSIAPAHVAGTVTEVVGYRKGSKEAQAHIEKVNEIIEYLTSPTHLAGQSLPYTVVETDHEGMVTVHLTPVEFFMFARDCADMTGDMPTSAVQLMNHLRAVAEDLITPDQRLAALLAEIVPVNHGRSN